MIKAKYKLVDDSYYSYIMPLREGLCVEVDGIIYFGSFATAKKALKQLLKMQLVEYQYAYRRATKLNKDNLDSSNDIGDL